MNFENLYQILTNWVLIHGLKIFGILAGAYFLNRFLEAFFDKAVKKGIEDHISKEEKRKRIKTLTSVFEGTTRFVIWIAASLMLLPEFGVNIAPLLAGIGVVGLAVGMAAKDIISDFIAGLFIILEDQYGVGDKVKIAGIEGVVEKITLRKTTIKDREGVFYSIPNSQIKVVAKKRVEE